MNIEQRRGAALVAAAAAAGLAGCQTAHDKVEGDGKWEATVRSHWFAREVKGLKANVQEGGRFEIDLTGYKGDTSEQLPVFTREMWAGLGFIGQLAATMYSPAAASVKGVKSSELGVVSGGVAAPAQNSQLKTLNSQLSTAACADGSCEVK